MTKYSLETKLEAVKAYINGMGSYKTVAQQYQVGEDDL
ncbi:hypothetical protein EDD57_11167, partial [Baia soyae]